MGLAASQARFLCITARKMNCEYKSTDLAQQKLEITNQLADISNEYSNAMNSTKLMWDNDSVGSACNVDYALLMSPSAANDYNPYMLSTASGAIVLNSEYAAAAKAAGISKAGGFGSQDSRDRFLSALCSQGIITEETTKSITNNFYSVDQEATKEAGQIVFGNVVSTNGIAWNTIAGMGDEPKDKYAADDFTLSQLCLSDIGTSKIDWAQVLLSEGQVTDIEYKTTMQDFQDMIASAQRKEFDTQVIGQLNKDYNQYIAQENYSAAEADKYLSVVRLAQNYNSVDDNGYIVSNGNPIQYDGAPVTQEQAWSLIVAQLKDDQQVYKNTYDVSGTDTGTTSKQVSLKDVEPSSTQIGFNTTTNNINIKNKEVVKALSVLSNGIVLQGDSVADVDIADVLTGNITVISSDDLNSKEFIESIKKIFDQIVAKLGYTDGTTVTGTGLNVDEDSASALNFAYNMIMKRYLNEARIVNVGGNNSSTSMIDNAAYKNAEAYNAVGTNESTNTNKNYAVSLSNMLSAFLTYYDNGLMGAASNYVVGDSVDTSEYVTEDANYVYLGKLQEESYSMREKVADFYDIMYNNIIENGWREDVSIDDSEYLEQCIKNGTYSMTSMNMLDGYYYQTRYNSTGYMVELADEDAIARAEAEFTAKKAELTYKEDKIDIKTKQLDAEISALTTEYETVKTLISNSIEKTFTMFSS